MPFVDYKGNGKKSEYVGSVYTLDIYERQFGGDLLKDVFGKITSDGDDANVVLNLTSNYTAELHAFWCMLRTADAINDARGKKHASTPPYDEWIMSLDAGVDMSVIDHAVFNECVAKFFPALQKLQDEAAQFEEASA